jgi:hypothetical protein
MALLSMGMTWVSFAWANLDGWRLAASRSEGMRRLCGAAHARGYSQEMCFAMRPVAAENMTIRVDDSEADHATTGEVF